MDWTEKYRPTTLAEVRGNNKARDALEAWGESWPEKSRAVILAGSPGVGKTSAAHALANDMGWEVVEVNASDSRKEEDVERLVGRASKNTTLGGGSHQRQLIVVDEADSFHRKDRGGARALGEIVKEAAQPMVLIVNDAYEMPAGLRRSLDAIDFRDVGKRSIVPVLRDVCRREEVEYEDEALDVLAEKNSGDLRSAINDLQALAETSEVLTAEDVVTGDRDTTVNIFEFLDAVLKEKPAREALYTAYDADESPDDLAKWVEDKAPLLYDDEELRTAYEFLSNADTWLGRVRASQNYSYWRYATDNVAAGVASARNGTTSGWTKYGGAPYRSSKDATRDRVARKVAERSGTSVAAARRELLPYLAAMVHHCKPRELTVAMAAAYDFDESDVSFLTGSGESTNKVESIVADAREVREELTVEHSGGAFEGATRTTDDGAESGDEDGGSDGQVTLIDAGGSDDESAEGSGTAGSDGEGTGDDGEATESDGKDHAGDEADDGPAKHEAAEEDEDQATLGDW